jgi:hypothetical protein
VIFHQPAQRIGAGWAGQVEVIDDKDPRLSRRVEVVGQGNDRIGRYLAIEVDQLAGILADPWLTKAMPRGIDDGSDEPGRVASDGQEQVCHSDGVPDRTCRKPGAFPGHGPACPAAGHLPGAAQLATVRDRRVLITGGEDPESPGIG